MLPVPFISFSSSTVSMPYYQEIQLALLVLYVSINPGASKIKYKIPIAMAFA